MDNESDDGDEKDDELVCVEWHEAKEAQSYS